MFLSTWLLIESQAVLSGEEAMEDGDQGKEFQILDASGCVCRDGMG